MRSFTAFFLFSFSRERCRTPSDRDENASLRASIVTLAKLEFWTAILLLLSLSVKCMLYVVEWCKIHLGVTNSDSAP